MDEYTNSLIEASMKSIKDGVADHVMVPMPKDVKVEAHGVRGMKSTPWRKTFKNADALNKWAEANDAEIHGVRDVEPGDHTYR